MHSMCVGVISSHENNLGPFGQSIRGVDTDCWGSKGAIGAHFPRSSINYTHIRHAAVRYSHANLSKKKNINHVQLEKWVARFKREGSARPYFIKINQQKSPVYQIAMLAKFLAEREQDCA